MEAPALAAVTFPSLTLAYPERQRGKMRAGFMPAVPESWIGGFSCCSAVEPRFAFGPARCRWGSAGTVHSSSRVRSIRWKIQSVARRARPASRWRRPTA